MPDAVTKRMGPPTVLQKVLLVEQALTAANPFATLAALGSLGRRSGEPCERARLHS